MNTQDFIDRVAEGKAADAQSALKDLISAKAFDAIDSRKAELSANLFGGSPKLEQEVATETQE